MRPGPAVTDRPPLTRSSRESIAHYRRQAAKAREDAARWDALADELETFDPRTDQTPEQETLL
ncbi:MAG: hypothetical protein M3Y20_07410 [Actinomycetota bacterium]|nr:hypothetical protein [Actinomycetota bacterium]